MRTPINDEPSTRRSQPVLRQLWRRGGRVSFGVKSCPDGPEVRLRLYPRKRTQLGHRAMSALCQELTHAPQQNESPFDLVISAAENRRWNRYTNRLGGPEVDKKLKFRGLLNRKIGGVCPFEDLVDERACASVQARHLWSIGCKHAGFPLLASKCNGRQSLASKLPAVGGLLTVRRNIWMLAAVSTAVVAAAIGLSHLPAQKTVIFGDSIVNKPFVKPSKNGRRQSFCGRSDDSANCGNRQQLPDRDKLPKCASGHRAGRHQ